MNKPSIDCEQLLPLESGRTSIFNTAQVGKTSSIDYRTEGDHVWIMRFSRTYIGEESWILLRKPEGIFLAGIGGGDGVMMIDPPLILIPEQVTEGDSWSSKAKLGVPEGPIPRPEDRATFSLEGSRASVDIVVDSRLHKARQLDLRIHLPAYQSRPREIKTVLWVAPLMGIVRLQSGPISPDLAWPIDSWELIEVKKKS